MRRRRFSLTRGTQTLWALPGFGFLLIAAVWIATSLQLQSTQRALISSTTHDTESFVAAFERYTWRALKDADRIARLVKHEYEQHGTVDLPRLIATGLIEDSGPVLVSIVDVRGNITASSQPLRAITVADREYFRLHAAKDTGLLDISKPVVGRSSGRPLIQLSRRINRPDGSFAGIVLLSVTPEYFMQFYRESDLGEQGSLGLLGLDGTYRASRVGATSARESDETGAELAVREAKDPEGHFQSRSESDHIARIVAYRKLADYPFIVTGAQSVDEALADFYRHRRIYLAIATIATLAILAFFATLTVLAVRLQRHRVELKAQRRFLETLVDNIPSGITVRSMRAATFGQYMLYNESNELIFGKSAEDALGKTVVDVMPARYAADIIELDTQLLASPMVQDVVRVRDLPGRGVRIDRLIRFPIFGADGEVDCIITSTTDITEERARTDELQLASKVFETTADAIMLSDADDRVVMVNAAFSKLTGYAATEIVGQVLVASPFAPLDIEASNVRMARLQRDGFYTGEVVRECKDGSRLSLWLTASCVRNADATIRNFVRVFTDISLLKQTQQKLEQLASFDTLTGLPNRRLLHDRLEQAVLRAHRDGVTMALMFIDLDGFKQVNDALGHDVGDRLLCAVAARLAKCVRASDAIGRFGGDEFAIVVEDANLPADAIRIGTRIMAALSVPFEIGDQQVRASASIGIAIYPSDAKEAAMLLKRADVAMYKAKRGGRNRFEFYTDADAMAVADSG